MRQTINGAELRRMIISAAASIEIHKQALNELNLGQSIGCFMVKDGRVVLRYSSEITDPLETEELVVSLIRRCGSEVCRCWDRIYSAAEV